MKNTPVIAFFGSSRELLEQVQQAADHTGHPVLLYQYSLDDALEPAQEAVAAKHIELIVSYRGTANLLRTTLNIPVLALQNLTLSHFRALSKAAAYPASRVFIPLSHGEKLDTATLQKLFKLSISTGSYSNASELEQIIRNCRESCNVVVAGGHGCRIAKRYGIPAFLSIPDENLIVASLENAYNIANAYRERELLLSLNQTMLDSVEEGMLILDVRGRVTACNQKARRMLSLTRKSTGSVLTELFPEFALSGKAPTTKEDKICVIHGTTFAVSISAVKLKQGSGGWLVSLQSAKQIISHGRSVSKAISNGNVAKYTVNDYVHISHSIESVLEQLRTFAASDSTVLISGESGTGKEILAHSLHTLSPRREHPFVSVNCAAIPAPLLESELFGYEGGAFTGSRKEGKVGLFELADGGTLFLDEVNSIPTNVQPLLLRTLQEREIRRVGSETLMPLDVRIVAATNQSLVEEVRAGRLREDLYYRISGLEVHVPPLRQRPEDIRPLVHAFIERMSLRFHLPTIALPAPCLEQLTRLPWYGNARELEHFIERLVLQCQGNFNMTHFKTLCEDSQKVQKVLGGRTTSEPDLFTHNKRETLIKSFVVTPSKESVQTALHMAGNRKGRAAALLGISRTTLWRLIRQLGLPD